MIAGTPAADMREGETARAVRANYRDPIAWLALGLGIAVVLVVTTHLGRSASTSVTKAHRTTSSMSARPAQQSATTRHTRPVAPPTSTNETRLTTTTLQVRARPADEPGAQRVTAAPRAIRQTTASPIESEDLRGVLSYPDDVASSFSFTTGPGAVLVTGTWSAKQSLSLSLRCPSGHLERDALNGTSASLVTTGGACSVSVAESLNGPRRVSYRLVLHYASGPSTSGP